MSELAFSIVELLSPLDQSLTQKEKEYYISQCLFHPNINQILQSVIYRFL